MKLFDYIEIRIPAKPQYVSVIRLTISGLAARVGFSYDEIEDLKIAVSEAVTNVVQHAYYSHDEDELVIGCALYEHKIEIMVSDYGNGFNFDEVRSNIGPYNENENIIMLREGGLGLYLMETLMDEVRVNNEGGVTVFMTKYVTREQVKEYVKESSLKNSTQERVLLWISKYQESEDEEAQTNLVVHYQQLVKTLAKKYSFGKSYYDDIVQVGMLGLLGAIRRFDTTVNRSFEAYAIPTIIGEIKRFIRDKTWDVHVPRRIKELGPKIVNAVEKLTIELQHSPSIQEISKFLEVDEEDVLEAMEMGRSYQALSVDHSIDADLDGSKVTLLDIIGQEDSGFEKTNQRLMVSEVMDILSSRERQIIQLTFLKQLSQKEAGELLGISQMHVSRIQRNAIKKLKNAITTSCSVTSL